MTSPRERGLGEGPEPPPPSHYLYVPNNAGLNGLNFLLSAGPPPGGLPHGAVPTLALPYVLVPSAALARYPPGPEAHRGNLSFSLPAHFMTPHTPKEAARSASKAFFQTPGTLGSGVSAAPAARRRGSAQRRLDVGHPPGNRPAA
ncbi:Transcription factor E2F7 [Liparis tanakae]|uniref:Transcription factor E2F7 n=1 Tax=Liparis tanakae TaxID=230148 RepID=A0A4Z2E3V4_9TELE|nr:Transcription factor E2F7 [Liparis tanakae]